MCSLFLSLYFLLSIAAVRYDFSVACERVIRLRVIQFSLLVCFSVVSVCQSPPSFALFSDPRLQQHHHFALRENHQQRRFVSFQQSTSRCFLFGLYVIVPIWNTVYVRVQVFYMIAVHLSAFSQCVLPSGVSQPPAGGCCCSQTSFARFPLFSFSCVFVFLF